MSVVGAFIALALAILEAPDWIPHKLLISQCCIGAAAILLIVRVVEYLLTSGLGPLRGVAVAIIVLPLILLPTCYGEVTIQKNKTRDNEDKERARLYEEINEFICTKSEVELRETFDIPHIERDGILLAKQNLTPEARTQSDADALLRDFRDGGEQSITLRYMERTPPNNVKAMPGKLGILILTHKYLDSVATLNRYASSALLPNDVAKALQEFERTLEINNEVLIDAINEAYASNPEAIVNANDCPKTACSVLNNLFYSEFTNLKPKADAIGEAIRRDSSH